MSYKVTSRRKNHERAMTALDIANFIKDGPFEFIAVAIY